MRKGLMLSLAIGLAATMLTGCVASEVPAYSLEHIPIETRTNQEFIIISEINPEEILFWEQEFDETKLELLSSTCTLCDLFDENFPYGVDNVVVGPFNAFHFKAVGSGETDVRLLFRDEVTGDILQQKVFMVDISP